MLSSLSDRHSQEASRLSRARNRAYGQPSKLFERTCKRCTPPQHIYATRPDQHRDTITIGTITPIVGLKHLVQEPRPSQLQVLLPTCLLLAWSLYQRVLVLSMALVVACRMVLGRLLQHRAASRTFPTALSTRNIVSNYSSATGLNRLKDVRSFGQAYLFLCLDRTLQESFYSTLEIFHLLSLESFELASHQLTHVFKE